jgi:hypothetical protein
VRCPRCGNDNFAGNRFCGMCGATLIGNQSPVAPATPAPPQGERRPEPPLPRRSAPVATPEEPSPAITGPSFLGLNKSDGQGQRSSGDEPRISSYGRGSADYLLDDDDEKKGGSGKWLVLLVALVLAGGFGYVRWKQGGFDWVTGGSKPTAQNPQSATDSGGVPAPAASSDAAPALSAAAPGSMNSPAAANSAPSMPPADATNSSSPAMQPAAPAANVAPNASGGAPADSAATTPTPASSTQPSTDKAAPSDSGDADNAPAPAPVKPAATIPKARRSTPITPTDSTAEAERYIYGNGVRQDCDRGMLMLKSAAESNPKAMVSMGALYSTGTCAPRDLPTAYRWFALALHKQPDNQALQDDLQKLWGQMTPPERQLAIKLSQ